MLKLVRTVLLTVALAAAIPAAFAGKQTMCPVSGDALGGDMGPPVEYVDGGKKVLFCCKSCVKKYKANPAKYAEATKKATGG